MKIEKIDENQVKITLSCTEMLTMNAQNISEESSNLLMELLETLEGEFCFSMIQHAITMEMVPSKKDGCEIYLTKTDSKKQNQIAERLVVTSFQESEDALYAGRLSKKHVQGRIAVYLMNNEFYLVISSQEKRNLSRVRLLLSDLGNSIGNPLLMESILKEYGTLIVEEDAPPLLN